MKKLNTNSVDKVEPLLFMLKCEMVRGSANSHFSLNLIPGEKTDRFFSDFGIFQRIEQKSTLELSSGGVLAFNTASWLHFEMDVFN